jgi:hypothetical protein
MTNILNERFAYLFNQSDPSLWKNRPLLIFPFIS